MNFEHLPINWENKGTEPNEELKKNGFSAGYKPPAAYHNFLFANHSDCIRELQKTAQMFAATIAARHLGNNPNLDEVNETGYYKYVNYRGEDDLLIVHNYPGQYNVQYRFTANSVERRFKRVGSDTYNDWTAMTSTDWGTKLGKITDDITALVEQNNGRFGNIVSENDTAFPQSDFYRIQPAHISRMPTDGCIYVFSYDEYDYAGGKSNIRLLTFDMTTGAVYRAIQNEEFDITKLERSSWEEIIETRDVYSQSPVRVGTWINGTPIWRIAFQKNFTEPEISEKSVSVSDIFSSFLNAPHSPFIVDYYVYGFEGNIPCVIDDYPCIISKGGQITCDNSALFSTINNGVYGWIEFVTPESNIK